jgi:chemotaxis signal transduction protein
MATTEIRGAIPDTSTDTLATASGARKKTKYLLFKLEKLRFALEILSVEDIIAVNCSADSRGTAWPTICGRAVPVVDLRCRVGSGEEKAKKDKSEERERYFVLVVQIESRHRRLAVGLVVDRVAEVLDLNPEIKEGPETGRTAAAPAGLDGQRELATAKLLDLEKSLPTLIRLDDHVAGLAAVCAN